MRRLWQGVQIQERFRVPHEAKTWRTAVVLFMGNLYNKRLDFLSNLRNKCLQTRLFRCPVYVS